MTKRHLFNGYSVAKETLDLYLEMQNLNWTATKYVAGIIKVGMNLPDMKALCENYLLEHGADSSIIYVSEADVLNIEI